MAAPVRFRSEPAASLTSKSFRGWLATVDESSLLPAGAGSLPELRRHRNFRIQHLRHRTPFLRRFRILLESRSIRAWHFPHHVNMAPRGRPSPIPLLPREGGIGVDALRSQL